MRGRWKEELRIVMFVAEGFRKILKSCSSWWREMVKSRKCIGWLSISTEE
jgi:hypothetical protein